MSDSKKVFLVADKVGQRLASVLDKKTGKSMLRGIRVKVGESFHQVCPVVDGKLKIPRWTHIPDDKEAKSISARELAAHKAEGDARAIEPVK